jgi:hypothetical protein
VAADQGVHQALLPLHELYAVALELLAGRADGAHCLALVDETANFLAENFDAGELNHSCAHDHPVTERSAIS